MGYDERRKKRDEAWEKIKQQQGAVQSKVNAARDGSKSRADQERARQELIAHFDGDAKTADKLIKGSIRATDDDKGLGAAILRKIGWRDHIEYL